MKGPSLCVVTPSFNQGRFIERTIRSVLDQGVEGLEYYVADGGSTDETIGILRRYDGRLRFCSERDGGQADAVNKGIRATSGEIIGWLNSDDIYYAGALKAVQTYFAGHPEAEVLYGEANHIDEEDRVIEPYYTEDWDYERLKEICFVCQPAVFFRRRLVERAGPLDAGLRFCMDYEYWLRLGALTSFVRLPVLLAGSRLYGGNKTLGQRTAVHREINDMLCRRLGAVPERWICNYAHAVVEGWGLKRDTPRQDRLFVAALVLVTTFASLRWNRRLSRPLLRTLATWLGL